MGMVDDIKPVTYLKARAADLLEQVNQTRRPVIITQNGEPRAVLQDPQSYEETRDALGMLKLLAQGEAEVREGRVKDQDQVFADLESSFKAKKK